ncbi:AAA family ATPase [Streptomyces tsukubensis]|nr:BTAD domain-containing putative transcriptional regulator [Streptomyces tsukubensis]QFR97626.1 AAA family ATPase [Streptomyces tsukubensis]
MALRTDGTAVPVGGARLRALLTVLALRPGAVVPVRVLIDEVWDGEPPADAPGALQALVGRLRRALGPDTIASADSGGYRLRAHRDDVDLYRFDRLVEEGTAALGQGAPAKAADALDEALLLWREPVLADLPARTTEAARWEARRLDARRTGLRARLALGRAESALPELTSLCDAHPLDEPLQALRLRALRDSGRPAEALAAYEQIRAVLADRLGTDPGAELRSLHAELLAPDPGPSSDRPPRPADRRSGAAADGQPPATPDVSPAEPSARRTDGPTAAPWTAPQGNIPARLTSFVGRESDIDAIRDALGRSRLVTLLGPGGSGKTRLSQEAGEAVARTVPDGVWLAELAPVSDPEAVPATVLGAVGARETVLRGAGAEELRAASERSGDDALARLVEHCASRRMLILLDNCEHVVDAAAILAQRLLESCPGLTVLATSREPLGVPGELLRPVEPLPEPSAVRLFAERGAAASAGFRIEDDPAAAAEICRRLDGLPLAIELAAARLRMLTPRQIADRLDDRFRLLTSGSRTVLPRQQTLRAVVDWSWDLLDDRERTVLRRLSVFAGGCDLAAAEAVCGAAARPAGGAEKPAGAAEKPAGGGEAPVGVAERPAGGGEAPVGVAERPAGAGEVPVGVAEKAAGASEEPAEVVERVEEQREIDPDDVAALLGSLVDKSLVVASPSGDGAMRYRQLETVGEYAAGRLDEAGDRTVAEYAHLVHYREVARTTEPRLRGPGQLAAVALLELEYENLRTALHRAVHTGLEQEALCLVLSLAWYWQIRDLRTEAKHWSEAAGTMGPDPFKPPADPAPPLYERCIDAPPPMRDDILAEARRGVHLVHLSSDMEVVSWQELVGEERLRTVSEVYRPGLPQTCWAPGNLWFFAVMMTGDLDRLREIIDVTVETCRELGYTWELAAALQTRSNLLANRSNWSGDASADADESLEIFRGLGDLWGVAEALSSRGEAREARGEFDAAAADFEAATEYAAELGAEGQVSLLRARLGSVLADTGEPERGEALLRHIIEDGRSRGHEAVPYSRLALALLLGSTSRRAEAREQLELLRASFSTTASFAVFDGLVLGAEAWLDTLDGQYEEALGKVRQALVRALEQIALMVAPQMPAVHMGVAALALSRRAEETGTSAEAETAAQLLGAASVLLPYGHRLGAQEREVLADAQRRTRAVLGDSAYEAAHAEGAGLSVEEAGALIGRG